MMQKKLLKKNSGFTLIELLVVVSIIAILVVVGLVSFTDAQRKAKNSQKISDLKALQTAYEQYYVTNGSMYSSDATCDLMKNDPDAGLSGDYTDFTFSCPDGLEYCVCVSLDNGQGNAAADNCSGTTGQYQCIENLQ
ncbi:MAG: hypothetical protein COY80_02565 [Candidatus Pacebacteria bacterium CG_4_10_14_0_8_um_filter_42_14]|nr:MAG: hypothetical protein COY80_02565 [Candidatus Pacebacteria bacterium CG_4_10_14_0_8_um_filter_42_14]